MGRLPAQRLPRRGGARLLLLLALLVGSGARTQGAELDGRRVTLEAQARPLVDVFNDVAQQTGAGVIVRGIDDAKATLALTDVPLADCLSALAEMFALVITWEDGALVVRSVDEAVREADRQLLQGHTEALIALETVAAGGTPMYGSAGLRKRLSQKLADLVRERIEAVLRSPTPQPAAARALASLDGQEPRVRSALAACAVRGLAWQGQATEALLLWDRSLQGESTPEAITAWGELFVALHYGASPQAFDFWCRSYSPRYVAAYLQEGWRQGLYRQALHFARLNLRYAGAAGRPEQARAIQDAIAAYLQSPRVIQLTCAVDTEATTDPRCEAKLRARVAKCSEVYDALCGIQFEIAEFVRWSPPSDNDFDRQYAALKAALGSRRPELAVGFILEVFQVHPADFSPVHRHLWTGYGCPHMGAYLLTRDFAFEQANGREATEWTFSSAVVAETLVHEMGHMFGALHVDDPRSVMRPSSSATPTFRFDDTNAAIIRQAKWKSFSAGTESLDEPELLGLAQDYHTLARMSARPNGAGEEEARIHLALARLYRERRDTARAREQAQLVLAAGAPAPLLEQARALLAAGG